ncbi:acyl-CoA dehydrogenase family protein [Geodermatophilus sp. DSM 44513]|uniref:acyl-CoA dehydrogenase family protein n=1 Tax=Geodermatophilus sp. DSM 44513 TaxID=1528104 RepID=UPI00127197DE|nr:acyl-CoA dehydrogenase family protein [Geodermatophilus sp. DSM 44513]WNV74380.1 acyl-CoA dehydrogenase family protein [Geodermatophilus sp. DSM 44513]
MRHTGRHAPFAVHEAVHEDFRETVRAWVGKEVVPFHDQWERDGIVPREVWTSAGAQGLLGMDLDERYGGGGVRDFRFQAVLDEEVVRVGATGLGFGLHNDVVAPYLRDLATEEQARRWLPGFCSGALVSAIAMTEPGAGSDLQGLTTTARRDGDGWLLTGAKTFITNGINADLVIVVARTDPDAPGSRGLSLLVVERGMAGFTRGRNLAKVGLKAQDTAELFFDGVRVPAENLLGTEHHGFAHLMDNLPQERLSIAVGAVAAAEAVLAQTVEYVTGRTAFGRPVGSFQHSRFVLAELQTEVTIARTFVDECVRQLGAGDLTPVDAAMAKYWTTELQNKVADRCLQLHGGYGYMDEYPVSKAWRDARIQPIYGGTNEIMREIVGRSLGL